MPEVNTGGEQRDYRLGCLPFVIIVVVTILAITIILMMFLTSKSNFPGFDFSDILNLDRLLKDLI